MEKQLESQITRLESQLQQIEKKSKLDTIISRFESCVSKLELFNFSGSSAKEQTPPNTTNNINIDEKQKQVEPESKLYSLKIFEDLLVKFQANSANLKPELKTMTDLVLAIVDQMIKIYKASERVKKFTTDQTKKLQTEIQTNLKKIQDFQAKLEFQPFSKAVADMVSSVFWVFSNELPYQFIQGQIESSEFHALKIKQQKVPEQTLWYDSLHASFKQLFTIVKTEFPTGLSWNFKGLDSDFDSLLSQLQFKEQPTAQQSQKQVQQPVQQQSELVQKKEVKKEAKKEQKNGHWFIENYEKESLLIKSDQVSLSKHIQILNCVGTNITIEGKSLSVKISNCTNCNIMFDQVVSCFEVIHCKKVSVQCQQSCPTFNADNSDQIKLYLENGPENTLVFTSQVEEMHVTFKQEKSSEDWEREKRIPNQFLTKWNKDKKVFEISVVEDC